MGGSGVQSKSWVLCQCHGYGYYLGSPVVACRRFFVSLFRIVATAVYLVLIAAHILRAAMAPGLLTRDLKNPAVFFSFYTFVAGTGMLASRFIIGGYNAVGWILGIIAAVSWLLLSYWIAYRLLDDNKKPATALVNGTWLLITVGVQSLAVTGLLLAPQFPHQAIPLAVIALAFWGVGIVFYLFVMVAIMGRLFFSWLDAQALTPPYWINMGAAAITTLAGAHLALLAGDIKILHALYAFIVGLSIVMWAFGSWWIPFLILMGWWRHIKKSVGIHYDPAFWSLIFPLGMYSAATDTLAKIQGLSILKGIVPYMLALALIAWLLAALGYLIHSFAWLTRRQPKSGKE